jgi:hypothetical protein
MTTAIESVTSPADLVDVRLADWEGSRQAVLEAVPRRSTVGQVVREAVRFLGLPLDRLHQAVLRGRELDPSSTLDEAGIESDDELSLVAEVSAG